MSNMKMGSDLMKSPMLPFYLGVTSGRVSLELWMLTIFRFRRLRNIEYFSMATRSRVFTKLMESLSGDYEGRQVMWIFLLGN